MSDPITAALIASLLVTKFTEGTAGEVGKKLVTSLWDAIATRFKGDKRAERALATVETEKTPESAQTLAVYLEDEMKTVPEFAAEVRQIAQQIQTLDRSQTQKNIVMQQTNRDQAKGYQIEADRIDHVGDTYTK